MENCELGTRTKILEKQWYSIIQTEENVVYNTCTKEVIFENRFSDVSYPFGICFILTLCILLGYIISLLEKYNKV